jgi:hypothetical protein
VIEEARELYSVPPPDFVARRNALVRQLKADGRGDDAKAVGALRRPRLSEYALNAAVREDDALGRRFATAVADATAAQSAAIGGGGGGGGGAEAMRAATRELRAATTALIEAAVRQVVQLGSGGDQWDEIEQLLRSLANRPGIELLQAGLVGSSAVDPDDLFAGAPEPPDLPARTSRATTKAGAATRSRGRTDAPAEATTPAHKKATAAKDTTTEKDATTGKDATPGKDATTGEDSAGRKRTADVRAARAEAARRRQLEGERNRARNAVRSAERGAAAARDVLEAAVRAQEKAERRVAEAQAALDAAKVALQALDEALAEPRSTD